MPLAVVTGTSWGEVQKDLSQIIKNILCILFLRSGFFVLFNSIIFIFQHIVISLQFEIIRAMTDLTRQETRLCMIKKYVK